jgi:hypothetical protein
MYITDLKNILFHKIDVVWSIIEIWLWTTERI